MILIDLVATGLLLGIDLTLVIDLLLGVDSLPPAPLVAGEEVVLISLRFEGWLTDGGVPWEPRG